MCPNAAYRSYQLSAMEVVLKFEDLEVWKRSSRLCADLYTYFQDIRDLGFVIRLPGLLYQYQAILQKVWNETQEKILPGFCNIQKVLVEN
jgi:hypothetical protein